MKIWEGKVVAAFFMVLSTSIFGQTSNPPVTITIGDPPFVIEDGEPSVLASITITENYPDALKDGFITLYGRENVEQYIFFTERTEVSSPSSIEGIGMTLEHVPIMIIKVDVDDTAIDSITIYPVASVDFNNDDYSHRNSELIFPLEDGHPPFREGQEERAAGEGVGLEPGESYTLGIYGGEGGIEIGPSDTLELAVGETVTLLFNEGEPEHTGDNIVESFDPQVVSVGAYSPTEVELTGQNPGEATVQAWDPAGNSGYLQVTVSALAPEPESDLPFQTGAVTVGPEASMAVFRAGAIAAGSEEYQTSFSTADQVAVAGEILPDDAHVGLPADLFIVVQVVIPAGNSVLIYKDLDDRFRRWDGRLSSLEPVQEAINLATSEPLSIYDGQLPPGEYKFYFGYLPEDGALVYGEEPMTIQVEE